jgi:hypothetical protein
VADQEEKNQPPNLIFYEVLTGVLDTGAQVLVQVFRRPDGTISLAQMAFRGDKWETWGKPIRLEHMGTHPTNGGAA